MKCLLDDIRNDSFNDEVEQVVLQIDDISDGPNGLPSVLKRSIEVGSQKVEISLTVADHLLRLLVHVDHMLRDKPSPRQPGFRLSTEALTSV